MEIRIAFDCPLYGREDKLIWLHHSSGKFFIRSTWDKIWLKKDRVERHHLIWFNKHFPRHAFLTWLAIKEKFITKDKLLRYKIITNETCILCNRRRKTWITSSLIASLVMKFRSIS